jgi:hypothetical protein
MTRVNNVGPEHFPYKDDAIAAQNSNPVRALCGCGGPRTPDQPQNPDQPRSFLLLHDQGVSKEALRRAAVLVPFYRDGGGQLRVVLIRRTSRGRHAGQIALLGGNWPGPRTVPVRYVEGELLWGLTLRILDPILPRALAGDWPV